MSFTIIDDGTDRQAWLARRQDGVSATDVARLARGGANTWAAVRAEKAGKGRDFTNAAMQHGTDREPTILRFAEKQFQVSPFGKLIAADDEPRFICTPDALGKNRVGEVKTTVHDWEVVSEVPGRYIDQVLWQMRVTGFRLADLIFEPHENGIPLHPSRSRSRSTGTRRASLTSSRSRTSSSPRTANRTRTPRSSTRC